MTRWFPVTSFSRREANMEEMNHLCRDLAEGLRALQALQRRYDDEMWDIEEPSFEKLRHIHIHLSSTVGKLARIIEPMDHAYHRGESADTAETGQALRPVLADLVMHAAQVATLLDADLAGMLIDRYRQNSLRFAPSSAFAEIQIAAATTATKHTATDAPPSETTSSAGNLPGR